jgi:hypothetical protein
MLAWKFSCRVLLFVFILLPVTSAAQSISGNWETKFTANGDSYILTLKIGAESSFDYRYTLRKGNSVFNGTLNGYGISDGIIQFIMPEESEMSITGKINNAYNKIIGNVTLKGKDYPAEFIKTGEAKQEPEVMVADSNGQEIIISGDPANTNNNDGFITVTGEDLSQPGGFNFRPLFVWASFWVVICLLLWMRFRKSKRSVMPGTGELPQASAEENEMISKLLPIVRLGRRRTDRRQGIIVSDGSLFFFNKRFKRSIAALHDKISAEEIKNCKAVGKSVEVPDDDVKKIIFEKANRMGRCYIRIESVNKTFKRTLPVYEMSHFTAALRSKFASRMVEQQPIRFHSWGLLILIAILSLVLNLALFSNALTIEPPPGLPVPGDVLLSLILIGSVLVLFLIPIIVTILEHMAAKPEKIKAKKKRRDLSHGQPFRSVPVSIFLKLVAIVVFFSFYLLKVYTTFSSEGRTQYKEIAAVPWLIPYLIVGLILSVSYSLAQRNPNKLRQKENKKPILYLRSFADDRETTLNLRSVLSFILGVDPPYYFLEQYSIGQRTWFNRVAKIVIRYLFRFHPLFLLRLMFGNPNETSEQQLGKYLQRYGFFVAIGKPGEKIVTTGASRMYVTNEEWQQTVLDLLQESSFVVLQPSRTKGVWWEVEQVFKKTAPEKILLSLVNYRGFQDDYETFRLRMESLFPDHRALPRSIGNESRIAFMTFGAKWEPNVHYLRNYWAIRWPFRGTTANLNATLKPYLKSLHFN